MNRIEVIEKFANFMMMNNFIIKIHDAQIIQSESGHNWSSYLLSQGMTSQSYSLSFRVFHSYTKLAMLALLSTLYYHMFALFFFICTN